MVTYLSVDQPSFCDVFLVVRDGNSVTYTQDTQKVQIVVILKTINI